jgi:hypothetical protein
MTVYETGPYTVIRGLGARYYRLALAAAARRDLSRAALYARYAVTLDHEHRDAVKLLRLCRYELGEPGGTERLPEELADSADPGIPGEPEKGLEKVRLFAEGRAWREAARAARSLPRQSVRVLNIQGCLWALANDPAKGADYFARALIKDRSNRIASEGLAELTRKRRRFWGILGKIL